MNAQFRLPFINILPPFRVEFRGPLSFIGAVMRFMDIIILGSVLFRIGYSLRRFTNRVLRKIK